ncbi:replicative DNA helicase [Delftia sp. PS-11]|uniref:replicative DNA helicase n=1 Tax=Delftia sp. PS-11 TaxID=2767222 RepID=UPI00245758D3|nr:DnaB-like helicase C-terminal domain-containing protein [Delftia sp. PS-11]KAJ8743667.1 AAA family ATPase [Delftia sp. PS-11]
MNSYDIPQDELLFSAEAEAAVLGAVLVHGADAYDAAAGVITADAFCDPAHRTLWRAAEKLVLAGQYVDVVAVMEALRGQYEDWAYANELAQNFVSVRAAAGHAATMARYAQERALRTAAFEVSSLASDRGQTIGQRVGASVLALESVLEERSGTDPLPVADLAASFIDRLMDRADGKTKAGRSTGFPGLDRLMPNGLGDGKLVVIAARPSVGKSSLAQQIAERHASDGIPAAFLGMEMENAEVVDRTVANKGRVPLDHIQTGQLTDDEWARTTEAVESIRSLPLYLYDVPGLTLAEVASKARTLVRKHGIKTLVVDYLQLMQGDPKKDRRFQLEEITRGLKRLAKQLGITVVLLSQLNRDVEKRTNPRPQMSDLKECGAIEEDADVILFLWDHMKGENGAPSIKGCGLGKNRGGAKGEIALHFEGQYQLWTQSTVSLAAPVKADEAKRLAKEW